MNRTAIESIISQYKKHGWELRRVLLSRALAESLAPDKDRLFGSVEILSSDLEAAWFSRASQPGRETWELRSLGSMPYAIDAFLSDDLSPDECSEILLNTEDRMLSAAHTRNN